MTLRRIAGLGALLSPNMSGLSRMPVTSLDSGDTPRMLRSYGPSQFVARCSLTSPFSLLGRPSVRNSRLCMRRHGSEHGFCSPDAHPSLARAGIHIRGST